MNTVDVLVLAVLLVFGVLGAISGFAWQIFRLGSWVLAFLLSARYASDFGALIPESWGDLDTSARTVIGWAAIFIAVRLSMMLVARVAKKLLDRARLATADRSMGFLLGVLKGAFLVALVLQLALFGAPLLGADISAQLYGDKDRGIQGSNAVRLHGRIVAPQIARALPEEARTKLLEELQRQASKG